VSFTPRPLYPRGKEPPYALYRGCVTLRAGLDAVVKKKKKKSLHCSCRESNPVVQSVAYSLYWLSYSGSYSELLTGITTTFLKNYAKRKSIAFLLFSKVYHLSVYCNTQEFACETDHLAFGGERWNFHLKLYKLYIGTLKGVSFWKAS